MIFWGWQRMVVHNDDDDYTILEGYSGFKLTQKCEEKKTENWL